MMKIFSKHKEGSFIGAGYSVRGASHIKTKKPNQDSFLIRLNSFIKIIVVADGVGSQKYSKKGSETVCKAVYKTFKSYKKGKIKEEDILTMILKKYQSCLRKKEKREAGTTCLFATIIDENLFIGQAGDGCCCIKIDDKFKRTKGKSDDFTNEVKSLNGYNIYNNWRFRKIDIKSADEIKIMLITDGISEDVLPDKMEEFFDFCFEGADSSRVLKNKLRTMLCQWSVPGSIDDKTIAMVRIKK